MQETNTHTNVYKQAYDIAYKDLHANYGAIGIYAGPKKHKQYWARDSFITSFGSCSLGEFSIVKNNLKLFLKYLRSDGHVPARIEECYHTLALFGLQLKRPHVAALHRQTQPWASDVVDSNAWYLICAVNYLRNSQDLDQDLINSFDAVGDWLLRQRCKNGLLYEGPTGNWSDCNLRKGNILYTNVLAWKAFTDIYEITKNVKYFTAAVDLEAAILNNFWSEKLGYFIDRIYKGKRFEYFYTDGNLLAILFGLATPNQTSKILGYIDANRLNEVPIPTGYPKLDPFNNLINEIFFPAYRTQNIFTWWGCILALVRLVSNDNVRAVHDFRKLAEKIVEYQTCHEVLTPEGKPVDRLFYKSEKQIAWTAGLYIYVYNIFKKTNLI